MAIAASGLRAQAGRMRIISENIANADSTPAAPGAAPHRRKVPSFQTEVDRTLDVQLVELGTLRRYGSAPGAAGVESALAMFSEMMRMRPAWARRPEAAMAMVLRKSTSVSFD